MNRIWPISALVCASLSTGCVQHKVAIEPIEIEPIHITMDINLNVRRELDDFFDFEEQAEPSAEESGESR